MRYFNIVFITAICLLLTACASVTSDIKVDANVDPKAKMGGYKTYDWLGAARLLRDPNKVWQPPKVDIAGDIKWLVDRELRKRGIFKTASKPDLAVSFFMGIDMEAIELKEDPESKNEVLVNVPRAGLIVVLIDVETGYVVWLGAAEAELQENPTDEVVSTRLDFAVSQMFKLLPKK